MKEWIENKGTSRNPPCHPKDIVDVKFRSDEDSDLFKGQQASYWYWDNRGVPGDIMSYKIIKEYDPENDDYWIMHYGGDRPCDINDKVKVVLYDGTEIVNTARMFVWRPRLDGTARITKYKIINKEEGKLEKELKRYTMVHGYISTIIKAKDEQDALQQIQKAGITSFELFESIGKYRKKEVIELEKY